MKEYVRRLFRVYRKRYGNNQKLLRSDEEHPFWAVEAGQPVCSRRTIYNIEEGQHQVNEDTLAFLIGKMGYVYQADEKAFKLIVHLAQEIRNAIIKGDAAKVKCLKEQTETLTYEGVFLFELYMKLINVSCKVYLENEYRQVSEISDLRYEADLFPEAVQYLLDYCLVFYDLFVLNDFTQANNGIQKLKRINEDDLLLLVIAQSVDRNLINSLSSYLYVQLEGYEQFRRKRLIDLLKICLDSQLLYRQKTGLSISSENNLMIRRIEQVQDYHKLPYLDEIRFYGNPLLERLYLLRSAAWARDNRRYKILAEIIEKLVG